MPAPDDIIETRLISEQQGVQMSTTLYWEVSDVGDNPTIPAAMANLAEQYVDQFRDQLSIQWAITCVLYRNITNPNEAGIPTFVLEAGSDVASGPNPATGVVRVTRYATGVTPIKLIRSSIAISGLTKDQSKAGRVESNMELGTLESFLSNTVLILATGWSLEPAIPQRTQLPPLPPAYAYLPVSHCITQGVFRKLRSRTSGLCGTA